MPKPVENLSKIGSKVDSSHMDEAVDVYLELEGSTAFSKSEIGRRLGLERAPEWLDSPIFIRKLDVARFTREVSRLRGVKELVGLLDQVLDRALIESMRRLVLKPEEIPSSVLFSETLIKLVRLRHELAGSGTSKGPQNIWINVQQEINNVQDPKLRQKFADRIFEDLKRGLKLLEAKDDQKDSTVDLVDAEFTVEPPSKPDTVLVPSERMGGGYSKPIGVNGGEAVDWSDPALD